MADGSRVYDGFKTLAKGVNGGISPSLIAPDQCAGAVNVTFRGAYPTTRNPFISWPLVFDSATTQSRWTGIFQGEKFYDGEIGQSGWVVALGGRLFFVNCDTFLVSEITPRLSIVTTADFTVPAANALVDVFVNSESALATGDTIYIDSGQYLITNRFTNEIEVKYIAGAANATALSGNGVLDSSHVQISEYETLPYFYDFVFMFQAENYMIILGGQHKTVIFDGSQARQASFDEVPPGVLGAYGWGRIWICRPDQRTFVAGDIVGGPSGTFQNGGRDAILKFTENDFLNEGGAFSVPYNSGPITAMQFLSTQDTSLGVGVLLVTTTNMVFSVNAPVDRTTWKNLQYPIQTVSLLDYGPLSPRAAVGVNGDMWYRSSDGVRSFIVARRNFGQPGNTPMSREVSEVLDFDTKSLLFYGSGINFDNKLFQTVSPIRTSKGVEHRGMVVINFDLISSLQGKMSPAWEGVSTGVNVLKFTKGRINDNERGFVFVAGANGVELWEIATSGYYDEQNTISGGVVTKAKQPVPALIETRSQDYGDSMALKRLHMAEIYLEDIVDTVNFSIKYRPDQYPCWIPWKTFSVCASVSQCSVPTPGEFQCQVTRMNEKLYAARITIPQPTDACNQAGNQNSQMMDGHEFQQRIEWTGHCRIRAFRTHAKIRTEPMEGQCPPTVVCKSLPSCCVQIFASTGSDVPGGGGIPPGGGGTSGGGGAFLNTRQCYTATCSAGTTGAPVEVCIEAADPRYSSNVSQADANAQALAAATAQANAALSCVAACDPGYTFDSGANKCVPTCHDESVCPFGYNWNGSAWVCATGAPWGAQNIKDLPADSCIKDFTFISALSCGLPIKTFPPPHDDFDCDLSATYVGDPGKSFMNNATVDATIAYGGGVDVTRTYTVTIRVRGVLELKNYVGPFFGGATGNIDPDQPYVFVFDPIPPAGPASDAVMAGGGENEYCIAVVDPITGIQYRYQFNQAQGLESQVTRIVDYTFKIQVKHGWGINLGGTSVDQKEHHNGPPSIPSPLSANNAPTSIRRAEPYDGQYVQLDVISIDYPV